MLKHHPKLKKLATRNGKVDGRKLRSKKFLDALTKELSKQAESIKEWPGTYTVC